MRIGFVTTEYVTEKNFDGGLANYLHRVCLSLQKLQHEPVVIVASDKDESIIHHGIEVHRVHAWKSNQWLRQLNRITRSYLRLSLSLVPSIWYVNARVRQLHAQSPFALIQYANDYALFRPTEVPCVIRLSSYHPLWHAAGAYHHKHPFYSWQMGFWEMRSIMRADAVYAPSKLIADAVARAAGRTVDVIEPPFLLDTAAVDDSLYESHLKDKTYLLFFGSLTVLKGVVAIAGILNKLLDKYQNLFFAFVGKEIGGYQGGPIVDYIMKQAGNHQDRVIYLGKLRHDQLYPILHHAHAVVLPSRVDNLPNTCLEAMAHKRVVIGTRGASADQLLDDGKSGFLCEIDKPESLLEAVEKALALNDGQREAMGQKAWQRIHAMRPEKTVLKLVNYYSEVISRFGAACQRRDHLGDKRMRKQLVYEQALIPKA